MNGSTSVRLKRIFAAAMPRIDNVRCTQQSSLSVTNIKIRTAAILVIGDEILKGQTLETNSHFLCKKLFSVGLKVKRIIIVPDDVTEIAEHVSYLSSSFDYVLTSGGVGPTHDDITYEGIAKAFNQKLFRHPSLVSLIAKYFGDDDKNPAYKMSEVPENAEVLLTKDKPGRFPLVNVKNVYILPGVPSFMERSFQCFLDKLESENTLNPPKSDVIFVNLDEVSITETLNLAVKHFESKVTFGSYPNDTNSYFKVRITMEAENNDDLVSAKEFLSFNLPAGSVVQYDADPVCGAADKLYEALENFKNTDQEFYSILKLAVDLLTECMTKKYHPSEICISFNGGKDCTALLHLYHALLCKLFPDWKKPITALYIRCKSPFPEVEEFINESSFRYKLKLCTHEGPLVDGLKAFTEANPHIKVILMGNRRTDPNSKNLKPYQLTDADWPPLMRVFPILDWTYKDLWKSIRHFQLPYCNLYDRGYTSLGSTSNTKKNSKLSWIDGLGNTHYRPAYELVDMDSERDGRV